MPGIDHLIRTDYKTVDKHDEVRNVLSFLSGDGGKPPIVTDHERPVGIVNDKTLMKRRLDPSTKLDRYLSTTSAVPAEVGIDEVVRRLLHYRASYLPVEDGRGKTKGYVRALDVARELEAGETATQACVAVPALREDQNLGDALHQYTQEYIDYIPVVDASNRITGVLPRSVLVQWAAGMGGTRGRKDAGGEPADLLAIPVHGVMDNAPIIVPPTTSREELYAKLDKFGYAIVQDKRGHYFGVVTAETILEGAVRGGGGEMLPLPPGRREPNEIGGYYRHS